MIDADLVIRTAGGERQVSLGAYLEPQAEEEAHESAHRWIKSLRTRIVDGAPFRERFTLRGDSLWWFTELYLHKEQVVLEVHRTLAALRALIAREQPHHVEVASGSLVVRYLTALVAGSHGIGHGGSVPEREWWRRLARLDLRARALTVSALLAVERYRSAPPGGGQVAVAAFIHRAFWRAGGDDGSAESYIGPVLAELERKAGAGAIRYVGIGPAANFRSRRRWSARATTASAMTPVERFAPRRALRPSRFIWRRRYEHFRILTDAPALRGAAVIDGVDCWPIVREQLAGVAWLQWPWSARAMDEAAAALDAVRPAAVATYAEAGGWGRALILEARRRRIPSAGLQHGFIYRHWLNYRHEEDEMAAGATPPFPLPTRTLLFDGYAAAHLHRHGRFPESALQVTGSPRLDALARRIASLRRDGDGVAGIKQKLGASPDDVVVLIATKEREVRPFLRPFLSAAAGVPGIALVIKPHPAETAAAYAEHVDVGQSAKARVLPADASLAELLAVARAVVTVNSTVALDAGTFAVPALVIGLPNNLSPFVDAGALAGTTEPAELPALLHRLLYDEGFRQQLAERRRALLGVRPDGSSGDAAAATAAAVLALARKGRQDEEGSG